MNEFYSKKRLVVLAAFFSLIAVGLIIRFTHLALTPAKERKSNVPVVERGSIVDRNGKQLAAQSNFYHFVVTPNLLMSRREEFASLVAPILKMNETEIVEKIEENKNAKFIYLQRKISRGQMEDISDVIEAHKFFNACKLDPIPGRIYPENSLASQLIGYMGVDGVGLSGIEKSQQDLLSPPLTDSSYGTIHGNNIYLTIDSGLQYKLEKICSDTMEETQAESLIMIAADSTNGEVLSYICLPGADLNNYGLASKESKIDLPATRAYEPGSVFKIFTVAAFLDSYAISSDDSFFCDGKYRQVTNLGERIQINCLEHHGWLNARTALKYSCNDALAQMSENLDAETFLEYIHNFGFGEKTGVELPLETRGFVKNTDDKFWSARSKATMAIGQELSVSALQMVQAATAIANKGQMLKITFVSKIADYEGNIKYSHKKTSTANVLKPSTADYILSCMKSTAETGTGRRASLSDISIGVKTGTAQIYDEKTHSYSDTNFSSSCMAIFPAEEPQIILYLVITKAKGEILAGRIAAPVIAKCADEIIDHLGMNRDNAASLSHSGIFSIKRSEPLDLSRVVPDFTGRPKSDLYPLLSNQNIKYIIRGEGWVSSQSPEPGTPVTKGMTIELGLSD